MFARFSDEARAVVVGAQVEARRLRHGWIGCEHLLLTLTRQPREVVVVFSRYGITSASVERAIVDTVGPAVSKSEALAAIGINIDDVRSHVEAAFGPGALEGVIVTKRRWGRRRRSDRVRACRVVGASAGELPFSPRAKRCLEIAATAAEPHLVRAGHVADALAARSDTVAGEVLSRLGVDVVELRVELAGLEQM